MRLPALVTVTALNSRDDVLGGYRIPVAFGAFENAADGRGWLAIPQCALNVHKKPYHFKPIARKRVRRPPVFAPPEVWRKRFGDMPDGLAGDQPARTSQHPLPVTNSARLIP